MMGSWDYGMMNWWFGWLGFLGVIFWIITLVDLILLGIWLWKQINKR